MTDPATEREGLHAVSLAFARHLHWLPREVPTSDYGVDLFVETITNGRPSGRHLAVQVKAGPSYFTEKTLDGIVFRDSTHLDYWSSHSLPVIVALYDPSTEVSYWQAVGPLTVQSTGKGWKMVVPLTQRIDADSADALSLLAGGDPYLNRLRVLRADLSLMRAAAGGQRVFVEAEEWVNKSSGRGTVRITVEAPGGPRLDREWNFLAPGWAYEELLPSLLPWADLVVDEELYEDHDRAQWDLETGAWDNEEGRYSSHAVEYEEWAAANAPPGLRPYDDDGEVAFWRLEARLSEVGEAFLMLDGYLEDGGVTPRV
jgi:hypothetical protein